MRVLWCHLENAIPLFRLLVKKEAGDHVVVCYASGDSDSDSSANSVYEFNYGFSDNSIVLWVCTIYIICVICTDNSPSPSRKIREIPSLLIQLNGIDMPKF